MSSRPASPDSTVELLVRDTPEEASREAARLLAESATNRLHIALSGGSTPRRAYELAAALLPDWGAASVWWCDERCVAPDDERSNYRLAREALLDRLVVPPRAVHRVRGELGASAAAAAYEELLRGVRLGLAFLGIGADGHTASLFPGSALLGQDDRLAAPVAANDVDRVTMTPAVLCAAETVAFLVTGSDKAEAVERAFGRQRGPATPASLIRSASGRTVAILDRAAAAGLSRAAAAS